MRLLISALLFVVSVLPTIAFDDPGKVANYERYRSGLPVVAVFERRGTNALLAAIKKQLSLAL